MKFKIGIFLIVLIGLVGGYGAFKNVYGKQCDDSAFIVGTAAGYAPFVSINEKGEYEGFDIDFANSLASGMGKKLVLKDLGSMTSLVIALEQGSIDAIIWGMSITYDRLKKFAMIHYQGKSENAHPLIFWNNVPAGVKTLADMKGMTVCVEPTSAQGTVLSKYKDIIILPTEKIDDALLNIQCAKADAAFVEPAIAKKFKAKFPELTVVYVPLPVEDQVQGVGVMVKQESANLIEQVRTVIDQLKAQGVITEYEKKWGIANE